MWSSAPMVVSIPTVLLESIRILRCLTASEFSRLVSLLHSHLIVSTRYDISVYVPLWFKCHCGLCDILVYVTLCSTV